MVRSFHTYWLIPLLGPRTVKGIDDTKPGEAVFALNCLRLVWMQSRELPASARAVFRLYSTALPRYDSVQSRYVSSLEGLHSWKFYSLFSLMPRWPKLSAKVWLVLSLDTALFFPPDDRVLQPVWNFGAGATQNRRREWGAVCLQPPGLWAQSLLVTDI